MKVDELYVRQMLDAIAKIEQFTVGMEKEIFASDQKTQSAVIMQLTVIGELAKKISDESKTKTDLPWREICGFRDRAIHDYFGLDLDIIWNTLLTDLPVLKKELEKLI